jgi:hypothetical protein
MRQIGLEYLSKQGKIKEGQNEKLIRGIKEYETRVVKGIEQQPDFKRQDKVETTPVRLVL